MDSDFWLDFEDDASEPSGAAGLTVGVVEGVEPLDLQLGVFPRKYAPEALQTTLFRSDDDQHHAYAILDAAKITNLPELLANSGLEHLCLFNRHSPSGVPSDMKIGQNRPLDKRFPP